MIKLHNCLIAYHISPLHSIQIEEWHNWNGTKSIAMFFIILLLCRPIIHWNKDEFHFVECERHKNKKQICKKQSFHFCSLLYLYFYSTLFLNFVEFAKFLLSTAKIIFCFSVFLLIFFCKRFWLVKVVINWINGCIPYTVTVMRGHILT